MPSTVTDAGPCRKQLQITVPQESVHAAVERSFQEVRATFALPGFRKGKAPRNLLERKFGDGIRADVMEDLIREGIQESIQENELALVSEPEVDPAGLTVDADADFSFEATVEIRPTVDSPNTDGITVTRIQQPITSKEVDNVLERVRGRMASMIPVEDRGATDSDLISGKMTLTEDEKTVFEREGVGIVPKDDSDIQGIPIEGGSEFFDGVKAGDKLDWKVDLPDTFYIDDLKGHTVLANFDIEEVKEMDLPELNDELAQNFDHDSLAAMTTKIEEDLTAEQSRIADHKAETAVLDALLERCEFDIPESVVRRTLNSRISDAIREQVMPRIYAGEQLDDDEIKEMGTALETELKPEVEADVRRWYLIDTVATEEKIFATESDIDERIEQMAAHSGQRPSEMRQKIAEENGFEDIRANILESKVRKLLFEKAEIVDETPEVDGSSADNELSQANEQGEGND